MECRTLSINLVSASNLENVREIFDMKVYAELSIQGTKHSPLYTAVDKANDTNPVWNCTARFTIDEASIQRGVVLVIKLYCKRTFGDRYIGEVRRSVKHLLDHAELDKSASTLFYYEVEKSGASESSQGTLTFSYGFGNKLVVHKETSFWTEVMQEGIAQIVEATVSSLFA